MRIPFITKFPVKVGVIQKRGMDSPGAIFWDRARFIRDGPEEYYELKKEKVKIKPPTYNYMILQDNGKPFVMFYEYARNMFTPVDMESLEIIYLHDINGNIMTETKTADDGTVFETPMVSKVINLKAADEDMSQWASTFRLQAEEKYRRKTFWEKYQLLIMMSFMLIFCIVLAYIFMQSISVTGQNISSALANALKPGTIPPPG